MDFHEICRICSISHREQCSFHLGCCVGRCRVFLFYFVDPRFLAILRNMCIRIFVIFSGYVGHDTAKQLIRLFRA